MDIEKLLEALQKESARYLSLSLIGTEQLSGMSSGLRVAIRIIKEMQSAEQAGVVGDQLDQEGLKKVDSEAADGSKD